MAIIDENKQYLFTRLSNNAKFMNRRVKGYDSSISPNAPEARKWYRSAANAIKSANTNKLLNDPNAIKADKVKIGRMYMFAYDAKWKDKLPYWDAFPLIFPIDFKKDGFLGINLHYLPPILRAKLMDELYTKADRKDYNEITRLKISYEILSSASRFKLFRPCIKRYLYSHVKSQFRNIPTEQWDLSLFLPLAKWNSASEEQVWADSRKIIDK